MDHDGGPLHQTERAQPAKKDQRQNPDVPMRFPVKRLSRNVWQKRFQAPVPSVLKPRKLGTTC